MRTSRIVVALLVCALAAACGVDTGPGPALDNNLTRQSVAPSTAVPPSGTPADPAPDVVDRPVVDTAALLGSVQPLAVPADPSAAASYLAAAVHDPATARAAAREILLRSGIGIFRTDTGALAATPADPSFLDAYLYDFEVPLLADSVADGVTTTLQPALDLAILLEMVPPDTDLAWMEGVLEQWRAASRAHAAEPLAFGGLATDALLAADALRAATPEEQVADPVRLDPIALQLFLTSLLSDVGHYTGTADRGGIVLAAMRSTPSGADPVLDEDLCNEPAEEYDSGLWQKLKEWAAGKILDRELGEAAGRWGGRINDYGRMLTTAQARYALLSGLRITVTSNARDTPHYRHQGIYGSGSEVFTFTALAEFRTELSGYLVFCGPLAGLRIPANKGIEGLKLQWELSDGLECTAGGGNCDKLKRGGGGGQKTDAAGTSKIEVQTQLEKGCPNNKAVCEKGEKKTRAAWARAIPDITDKPPIDLGDLIMDPGSLPEETIKALVKVLMDILTDLASSAKAAKGTQTVEYHEVLDYRVHFSNEGILFDGVKCAGSAGPWTIAISGRPGPNTKASGSVDFTLDENGAGRAAIDMDIVTKVKAGGKVIKASVEVDGSADIDLVESGSAGVLQLSNARGDLAAAGSGPGVSINRLFKSVSGDGGGGLPVEIGRFCKP